MRLAPEMRREKFLPDPLRDAFRRSGRRYEFIRDPFAKQATFLGA